MRKNRKPAQGKPRDDAAQLRLIADNMPAMSIAYDEHLHCLFGNRRFAEFFGLTTASIVGKHLREIIGEGPYQEVKPHFDRVLEGHRTTYTRTRVLDNGGRRHLEVELIPNLGEDGRTRGLFAVTTDVTERKNIEEDLRRFRAAMDASGDAILLIDRASMRYVDLNQTFCDLVGYTRQELLGMTPMDLFSADRETLERDYDALIADAAGRAGKIEGRYRHKDGSQIPIETQRRALHTENGWIIVASARDITERKQAEERLQRMAHHDSLTGLPNRLLFNDRLSQAISIAKRNSSQCALLYLDLDKFKPVNDTLGHDSGDQFLKIVAARILAKVRESDTVARVGGDEFTVILRDIASPQNAAAVAQKIIEALAAPFRLEGGSPEMVIGSSIGIAVYPGDGQDHDSLVKKADAAMYSAKAKGNCFRFYEA